MNSSPFPYPSALQEKSGTGHRMALVRKGACCELCENQTGLIRLLASKILQPTCIQSEGPLKVHATPLLEIPTVLFPMFCTSRSVYNSTEANLVA